jgi:carbon monoxide dehydrogenase subunit G
MRFDNGFDVKAPIEEVWSTLLDVERVAPCMPGAEVIDRVGDDAYKVAIRVKVGPVTMRYRGEVEVVERDDDGHRATMRVKAKEARGQGTADANVRMALDEQAGGTRAGMETEVQLSGKVAAMGQGVIADISARLVETFAANLAAMLERGQQQAAAAEPAKAAADPTAGAAGPDGSAAPSTSASPAASAVPGRSAGSTATGGASAATTATDAGPGLAAATAPSPEPSTAAAPSETSLPIGKIAASMIAARLGNPRTIGAAAAALALVAVGFLLGRRR